MNEWLKLIAIPLGYIVQVLRGNAVPAKVLVPSTVAVCCFFVWLAAPNEADFKTVAREGAYWILITVGAMFGTAYGAYKKAAAGANPEERTAIAASPWVPVTDPNKEIHK